MTIGGDGFVKPMKLVMSGFGPYKGRVEIDFEKLGNNGIFLITGDTGAGKTIIFDAISFALFGVSSGSRRDNGTFRSDFAADEDVTSVYLEFVHKGILYKLERIPRYSRKKKRGVGSTFVGGEANLIYLDEVIIGDKNVTDKCVKILGMNAAQFKQIVMIAQGEFMELLLAKPRDRADIFRYIFDTGIFREISDELKGRYLNKKREYEDVCLLVNNYLEEIKDKYVDKSIDELIDLLGEEIAVGMDKEERLQQEHDLLFSKSCELVKRISEVKLLNDSINELKSCEIKLDELLQVEDTYLDKEFQVRKNRDIWEIIEPCRLDVLRVNNELLSKKESLEVASKDYENVLLSYYELLKKYEEVEDKSKKIRVIEEKIRELEKQLILFEEIDTLEKEWDRLHKIHVFFELDSLRQKLQLFNDCKAKELHLNSLRDIFKLKKDKYIVDNKSYLREYDLFLSNQAGILASNLIEGKACPVCGSLEHPNVAKVVENVLVKEELDSLRDSLDEKALELENCRLEILEQEKVLEVLKHDSEELDYEKIVMEIERLTAIVDDSRGGDFGDYNVNELEIRIVNVEEQLNVKKKDIWFDDDKDILLKKLKHYQVEVDKYASEIVEIKSAYEEILKEKIRLESVVVVLGKDVDSLEEQFRECSDKYVLTYKQFGYNCEEDFFNIRLEKDELKVLEKEILSYKESVSGLKEKVVTLEKVIAGKNYVNSLELEEQLSEVNKQLDIINVSLKNINNDIISSKKILFKFNSVSEKVTKLEHELMIYKDLSDTANGNLVGKNKLEFEQFVQAGYFDQVLLAANKRFLYMTDERYELFRKEEAVRVSDKLGLEIEVMDYYTGKRRDIKTLSGGESFKASLSLALGMSDVIQEFAGGILVEAMFIDEGFGSLDDDSLEQALDAIMMISKEDKLIGVISHVSELKSRIDKKIVVKKGTNGSNIELEV